MDADARLAAEIAEAAGRLLLEIRSASGLKGKELGKAGDQRSNMLILDRLRSERPGDAILSEESADDPARLDAGRVWIVDPLDGTREYSIPGRRDWAVHVALWERGTLVAGAVAQPALGEVYSSDAPVGVPPVGVPSDEVPSDGVPVGLPGGASGVVLVSDSRPPVFAPAVAAAIGATVAPMGSAGAKAMAVVRGEAVAYLHAGGQWEWDSAAPVAVAVAAGLHASRIDGTPLLYNRAHPYLPDLLICRQEVAAALLAALGETGAT